MTGTPGASAADEVNRRSWSAPGVADRFDDAEGIRTATWSDPGEQAAISHVADDARGGQILDIGVGAGRTVTLLRLISDRYVAIDYTPEMVQACARRHPDVDVRAGDARDLSAFADAGTNLVVFSYNGLDAVSHGDRAVVLGEIARVLGPDGLLQFSTMNLDGPCYRATPARPAGSQLSVGWSSAYRTAMRVLWLLRAPVALPRARRNRRRLLAHGVHGGDWAVAPMEALDFGLLVHYSTLARVRAELADVGLVLERVFDAERGRRVGEGEDLSAVRYFQLVARRR